MNTGAKRIGIVLTFLIISIALGPTAFAADSARSARSARSFARELQAMRVAPGCFALGPQASPADPRAHDPDPARSCERAQKVFQLGKSLYLRDSAAFISGVKGALDKVTSAKNYNYLAVLLAAASGDSRVKQPLEKLAAREKKQNIMFQYAARALEKIDSGQCESATPYEELCTFQDAQFTRARLMIEAGAK